MGGGAGGEPGGGAGDQEAGQGPQGEPYLPNLFIYLSIYLFIYNISMCKVRCFNCGNVARHLAAECPHPPLPKRCHHCKVETEWNV